MTVFNRVKENIDTINHRIKHMLDESKSDQNVDIVAVTKYATNEETQAILNCGIRQLGENKIQVAEQKIGYFGCEDIVWHLIGHLQTNKVKKAVQLFDCIQSVDSLRVLKKIDAECLAIGKVMPIFIQINMVQDPNKYGFSQEELVENLKEIKCFRNVIIKGIMIMGPNVEDPKLIEICFRESAKLFEVLQKEIHTLSQLSMGMSQDFELAVKCGSTMLRLGSSLYKQKIS